MKIADQFAVNNKMILEETLIYFLKFGQNN
jgi:hypothetical protein